MDKLLAQLDLNQISQWAGVIAAVGAMLAAWVSAVDARRSARQQRIDAKAALEAQQQETARQQFETQRQAKIALEQLHHEHGRDLQKWADEVIDLMAEAQYLCFAEHYGWAPSEISRIFSQIVWKLSALIDRGRMYFPNVEPDAKGVEKEAAFRGFRQKILNHVIFAHEYVKLAGEGGEPLNVVSDKLYKERRLFVSEFQSIFDPRGRDHRLRRLAEDQT